MKEIKEMIYEIRELRSGGRCALDLEKNTPIPLTPPPLPPPLDLDLSFFPLEVLYFYALTLLTS